MDSSTLAQVDDEDVALIVQLLKQDGEEASSFGRYRQIKQPDGTGIGFLVAFNLFMEEL